MPNPISRIYPGQLNYLFSPKSLQQNWARASLKRYLLFPWEIGTYMEISGAEICSIYAYQCRTQSMPRVHLGLWCLRITKSFPTILQCGQILGRSVLFHQNMFLSDKSSTKVLYLPQPACIIQRKNLKKERDKNFLSSSSNLSLALLLLKKVVSIPLTSWLQGTPPLHQGGLAEVHLMSQALLEERTKAQMGNCTSITWPFTHGICKNQLSFLPFLISEQQVMSDFVYNYVSCLLTFVDQLHFQTSASNIFFWPESGSDALCV